MRILNIILLSVLCIICSCYYNEPIPADKNVWPVASPEEVDMIQEKLLQMDSAILVQPGQSINSVVIVKSGHLVYEKYYNSYTREDFFNLGGVGIIMSNLALGKAIEMGLIESVDDSLYKYLPDFKDEFDKFPMKKNITFRHLMTMKSGLSWNELSGLFGDSLNDLEKLELSENWVEFIITKPLDAVPGSRYSFNSATPVLLSAAIESQYKSGIKSFLLDEVLNAININNLEIERINGNANTGWGISMATLDLVKVGYLYLEQGNWFGDQTLNSDFVESSTSPQTNIDYFNNFGWMWWRYADGSRFLYFLEENDTFFAAGNGENRLYIVPHLDLVVAFTGAETRQDLDIPAPLYFRDYILRSIQ